MMDQFGADTGRLFELFAAPPERDMDWTTAGAEGAYRFINRVFKFVTRSIDRLDSGGEPTEADRKVLRKLHQTIEKITSDFESRWHFNTSIAAFMELFNEIYANEAQLTGPALREVLEKTVLLLAPFTPYVCEEMWALMGRQGPVFKQPWPECNAELAKEDGAEVIIQVNGKLRSKLTVPFGTSKEELEKLALADEKARPFIEGRPVVKVVIVPDRLVNVVVKG
jgi:leucyl-tRNA synthetase